MAGNLTENFSELCRLCASKISLLLGINIFQGEGSAREISKKISTCLPIQVLETDRLPKMICNECVYKLDVCFQFHEKCRDTENLFVELMNEIKEPKSMNIQIVQSSQEILDHSNISLPQLTTNRENIMVGENIILNDNIAMHNHELDNIEISPHELNSHEITHPQQLDLHHGLVSEMQIAETHLNVQNLDLIHSQHSLISNYEPTNNGNCVGSDILMKEQRESVKVETVNSETQNELIIKTMYSDASETESSDSELETSGEKNDPIDLIHDNVYEDQNEYILSTNETEVGTSEDVETNQYYCNVCGKAISGKEEYLDHYGEHLNKCLLCDEDFSNLDELKTHRQETHSSSSVKIEQSSSNSVRNCLKKDSLDNNFFKEESSDDEKSQEAFMNENDEEDDVDDLEDNNKNTKRKRWEPKVCKECGKTYKTNYKLAEHMRKHTGEQPFKCSMCDKAFRSKIGLAQHEAKHTGNYDYSCPTCGKGFQCKSYLIVHQRVHSNLKPYPCSQCGRNFKTKQSLLDHMNRHLGVKPFMCEICGRSFITKGLCKSHQKVHSGRDNRQFPCTVCNKLFVSKSYLNTHLRIHTGEKPFMCEVCGKGFLTRVDLRIHSTMHTGEKSFVCEICGKAFARRDALRCHRRSHTGERPYRCDVCGQTFTQFSPMAIHKRLHTGERPYTCEICKKSFVSRSTMMSHRKKHVP